ncbi:MAG: glycosyltransferase family 39 protein [Patescibacteria group bacterium]
MLKNNKKYLLLLFFILAIAAFLRFWQLGSIPPGLWPDETAYANDALESLETGSFKIFYPDNHGREGLFMWILAFSFSLFGVSILSFKIIPATIGVLTVLGQYLLCLEIFRFLNLEEKKVKLIALLSSFFIAISFWHINFSRIGFRAILTPLILVFSFYFFFRASRTKKLLDFILSGLIFGLGFYTYISFRLAVIVIAFLLIFWFFVALKRNWQKKYIVSALFLSLAIIFIALPIGIYFLNHPQDFISRSIGVSIFEEKNPLKLFVKNLGIHLLMFNFRGDVNLRHNLSGFPQLSPLAGIFFLIGIIWCFYQIIYFKNNQINKIERMGVSLFLLIWFLSLLLPSVLTTEGIPHALRPIGVIPVSYIFSGLGAYLFYEWIKGKIKVPLLNSLSFLLLILMLISSFVMYFLVWAKNPKLEDAFTIKFFDVGKELNNIPEKTRKYVIKNEGDLPTEVSRFIQKTQGRNDAIYVEPEKLETINFLSGDFVFTMNKDLNPLKSLLERFPKGNLIEKDRIWIFEIF